MTALEEDTTGQPDTLLYRAEKLAKELELLGIVTIVSENDMDPHLEFLEKYGDHPDDLIIWHEETTACVKELGFKFKDMVAYAKRSSTSSFKKRSYPSFAGNILNYYEFKQQSSDKVVQERLMEIHELKNPRFPAQRGLEDPGQALW